jgi:hypothetical protein
MKRPIDTRRLTAAELRATSVPTTRAPKGAGAAAIRRIGVARGAGDSAM